jgi:glycosyltransferase involved in cell wall biosynthesis
VNERVPTLVSVCAPMLDEQGTARVFYERVCAALADVPFELVIVDDGSTDATHEILAELAAEDERVKVISLSRNFGHQTAITAAMDHADGDVVVMIDADLQDPPELIVTMLERWSEGCDVVYAARRQRVGETRFKLATARTFYRMLTHVAGDFRLLDRRAVDALLSMRERNRYLRGMTVWVGFTQIAVPYDRDARFAGETKYTLRKMIRFSLDAIASFSHAPLQAATLVGFLFAMAAFVCIPIAIGLRLAGQFIPGFATEIIVILLLGGIQLMAIGVIGEYVGRIYDEVKRRPLYVVRGRRNLPDHSDDDDRLRHERTPAS